MTTANTGTTMNPETPMSTFANDHNLARLPIPDLNATCAAIKDLVAPLVDAQAQTATAAALAEFAAAGGAGEKLQRALLQWQSNLPGNTGNAGNTDNTGNASWLRPFWDDMYLAWRGPLPLDMNYYLALKPEPLGKALPVFVRDLTRILLKLGRQTLPPEVTRGRFQAMDQIRSLIYTRIPAEGKDSLLLAPLSGPVSMVVVRAGHWFCVPLLDADGEPFDAGHFAAVFAAIRSSATELNDAVPSTVPPTNSPTIPLGAMTTTNRPEAARIRAALLAEPLNRLSLSRLEKSLFVVCLDSDVTDGINDTAGAAGAAGNAVTPGGTDEEQRKHRFGRSLLGGAAGNRWFDKSLQIIASDSGELGLNLEHAGCDAAIWLYVLNQTMALPEPDASEVSDTKTGETGPVEKQAFSRLKWKIFTPEYKALLRCEREFAEKMRGIDLYALQLCEISSERIKALRCSPDAFVQQAFQVAQYQTCGRMRSAYEAVTMRGFAEGRTECARPSSAQALALARAVKSGADTEALKPLFRAAEAEHLSRLKKCREGCGVERHMYGLRNMLTLFGEALGVKKLPAIFNDAGWQALGTNALSTSGVSAPYLEFFGFGPVEKDGFGLGYCIGEKQVNVVITCHNSYVSGNVSGNVAYGDVLGTVQGDISDDISHSVSANAPDDIILGDILGDISGDTPGDILGSGPKNGLQNRPKGGPGAEDFARALTGAVNTLLGAV